MPVAGVIYKSLLYIVDEIQGMLDQLKLEESVVKRST
jgi:hypothetical protein